MHTHGKIWAESEGEGKGCTFFVHLPLHSQHYVPPACDDDAAIIKSSLPRDTPRPAALAVVLNRAGDIEQPDGKQAEVDDEERGLVISPPLFAPVQPLVAVSEATWKPTILVVDDSAMNRKMLVRMLMSNGFACLEAEDGMEGLIEVLNNGFRNKKSVVR